MSASVDISKFTEGLGKLTPQLIEAVKLAVRDTGMQMLGNAQQLCPEDTGALKDSASSRGPIIDGSKVEMVIGFNTVYAAAVHEVLTAEHKNGQAKYLETAVQVGVSDNYLGRMIQRHVRAMTSGGES